MVAARLAENPEVRAAWNYASVLKIYQRIEDWHGPADPERRGTGGPVYVAPAHQPKPAATVMLDAARSLGVPTFDSPNGAMMEGHGGAAINDLRIRDGKRLSVFRSYTYPRMAQPNLTVLTGALVSRLTFENNRVTGWKCCSMANRACSALRARWCCRWARSTRPSC